MRVTIRQWLLLASFAMFLSAAFGGYIRVGRLRIYLGWLAFALWALLAALPEEG